MASHTIFRSAILLGAIVLSGCREYKTKPSEGFSAKVQAVVYNRCVSCHAGGIAENGFGFVDKPALLLANGYIVPGDAESSKFYQKLLANPPYGQRMPFGGPYLSDDEISAVKEWIDTMSGGETTVTISAQSPVRAEPSGAVKATMGRTLTITLSGRVSQAVGGDCPKGVWSGNSYTSGIIQGPCSIQFVPEGVVVVTVETTGISAVPAAGTISLSEGSKLSLELDVRDGDSLSGSLANNVEGTCPKGSFNGLTYETGPITKNCTLKLFADNPCGEILPGMNFVTDIQPILSNPIGSSSDRCTNCHYLGNAEDLPAYATASGGLAEASLVLAADVLTPGRPRSSKLYLSPSPEGSPRMPYQGQQFLTANQLSKLCNWILESSN